MITEPISLIVTTQLNPSNPVGSAFTNHYSIFKRLNPHTADIIFEQVKPFTPERMITLLLFPLSYRYHEICNHLYFKYEIS